MRHLAFAAAALTLAATPAAAAYIYSPTPAHETVEGNVNNGVFDATADRHWQWWYDASIFGDGPLTISAISFRYDAMFGGLETLDYSLGAGFELQLDTIAGPLSATYADNLPSPTTVMSGARTLSTTVGGPSGQTKPFGIHFVFDTPFHYDPADGDLVIDLVVPAAGFFGTLDFASGGDLAKRVFNLDAAAAGGSIQALTPVTRFDVSAAPEPAAWTLMITGFGLAGAAFRRRGRLAATG